MRFYTSIILFLLFSVGMTVNSVAMEHQTSKSDDNNSTGQVSTVDDKEPEIPERKSSRL